MDRGAGQLIKSVAFDARSEQSDGMGNVEGKFEQVFATRAAFRALRGTESVLGSRLEGQLPIIVRVRATPQTRAIESDWQMRDLDRGAWAGGSGEEHWTGPIFAVRTVSDVDDGRHWLDILVVQGGLA